MRNQDGLTLIELVVSMVLVAVLAAWAIPSLSHLLQQQRLTVRTNELVTALHLARTTAIQRGVDVMLCASADGVSCGSDAGYTPGWLVFEDRERNGFVDPGERLLSMRRFDDPSGPSITGNRMVADYVSFDRRGYSRTLSGAFQAGTVTLCGKAGQGRAITLNRVGRVRTSRVDCPDMPSGA